MFIAKPAQCAVPDGTPTFSNPLDIDNPYTPFPPGRLRIYSTQDTEEPITVVVDIYLLETRIFEWNGANVACRILETLDFEAGQLTGVSRKYLAQADDGTVYFFGEITSAYIDDNTVVHFSSWLVGGPTLPSDPPFPEWRADPTIYMLAQPEIGDRFKREDIQPVLDETIEIMEGEPSRLCPRRRV